MKYTALLIITLLTWSSLHAQTSDAETAIKDIRTKYATIIGLKEKNGLKVDEIDYECPDYPAGGTVWFYTDGDKVKLIEHSFSEGDHYGGKEQYFVWGGELFFCFSDVGYWTFDMETVEEGEPVTQTKDIITESRFYFHKGAAVRCLVKNYEIRSRDAEKVKPENIPNEETNCREAEEVLNKFKALMALRGQGLNGQCIWEE